MHWLGETVAAQLRKEFPTVEIESFPKQPKIDASCPFGSAVRLFGKHYRRGVWGRVGCPRKGWLEGDAFVDYILAIQGDDPAPMIAAYEQGHRGQPAGRPGIRGQRRRESPRRATSRS